MKFTKSILGTLIICFLVFLNCYGFISLLNNGAHVIDIVRAMGESLFCVWISIGFIVVIFIIVNDEIVKLYKEINELKKQLNKNN